MMFNRFIQFFFLFLPCTLVAVPDVSVQIHRFHSAQDAFAELSIYIVGSSITCNPSLANDYGVNYTIIIKDKEQNVVAGNRYKLLKDGCPSKDLIDAKRFVLLPGMYTAEVEFSDVHDSLNNIAVSQQFEISSLAEHVSDVQLLSVIRSEHEIVSPLHKSGLYLEPLPFKYYYPDLKELNIYIETYRTDQLEGQPYLQYTIKPVNGDIPSPIIAYRKVAKLPITPNVLQLDIASLISGTYSIEASLFDGNKKLVSGKTAYFSRYNPVGDSLFVASGSLNLDASFIRDISVDSLDYHLKAMAPIVNSIQVDIMNSLLHKGSTHSKQFFLHRYWTERAGKFADQAFASYMQVARAVDDAFRSGFGYGFETDRGHIFLKYGRPDDIIEEENDPSAPPYEIWFYNTFPSTHQNNVRFLFYNPSLAKNAYTLLHSTAIGEVKNERWEVELYRDATLETPSVGVKEMGDNVYRNARRYFEQ